MCDVVDPVTLPPFQVLLDEHRDDVYRFLRASVGPHDADDCFQETFISALRAYPRLRADSNLRGWLFTIAHRKALDSHRARGRRAIPLAELPERVGEPLMNGAEPELWREVGGLPPKQKAAVLLRFAGDLAYREIGEAMGSSEEAARRNVLEGLRKLREVVERGPALSRSCCARQERKTWQPMRGAPPSAQPRSRGPAGWSMSRTPSSPRRWATCSWRSRHAGSSASRTAPTSGGTEH